MSKEMLVGIVCLIALGCGGNQPMASVPPQLSVHEVVPEPKPEVSVFGTAYDPKPGWLKLGSCHLSQMEEDDDVGAIVAAHQERFSVLEFVVDHSAVVGFHRIPPLELNHFIINFVDGTQFDPNWVWSSHGCETKTLELPAEQQTKTVKDITFLSGPLGPSGQATVEVWGKPVNEGHSSSGRK